MSFESRAKIIYEQFIQFTNDVYVKGTLRFLMTREMAHYQMFEAIHGTIKANLPPGILQRDLKHRHIFYFSEGCKAKGPWNQGSSMQLKRGGS